MKLSRWLPLLLIVGCKEPAPEAPPPPKAVIDAQPDWKGAFKHTVRFEAASSELVVDVVVAPGFHAYTIGETVGKPMALELSADGGWEADGEVVYPKGVEKDLPIGKSVIVEGSTSIKAKIKAKTDPKSEVKGTFRYQVCNESACDRPRNEPFTITPA
jgi:hypothetical protein